MFLTEIRLQDKDAARLFPANPYDWHKVVWSFFPDRAEREFLYRVDYNPRGVRLMLLSSVSPCVPFKQESYTFKCREIPESFFSHELYRFQVRVNPTKRIKTDARSGNRLEKGMRVSLTDENELLLWLQRKGEQSGFSLPGLEESGDNVYPLSVFMESRLNFQKKGYRRAHHSSVQFSGVLQVVDPILFRKAFQHGIGSAKAFGFGLLMLQPLY